MEVRAKMEKCRSCVFARWDYETFYGTSEKQFFVSCCMNENARSKADADGNVVECTGYKERRDG